jgi:hypothetical protein
MFLQQIRHSDSDASLGVGALFDTVVSLGPNVDPLGVVVVFNPVVLFVLDTDHLGGVVLFDAVVLVGPYMVPLGLRFGVAAIKIEGSAGGLLEAG